MDGTVAHARRLSSPVGLQRASPCHTETVPTRVLTSSSNVAVDRARLAEICSRYGVAELFLFGSAVRGEDAPTSDIDLLYVPAPGTRLGFSLIDLEDELSDLFGRPVDLVSKRSLHPAIRDDVLSEARHMHPA